MKEKPIEELLFVMTLRLQAVLAASRQDIACDIDSNYETRKPKNREYADRKTTHALCHHGIGKRSRQMMVG